jgi:hypothetical protein
VSNFISPPNVRYIRVIIMGFTNAPVPYSALVSFALVPFSFLFFLDVF